MLVRFCLAAAIQNPNSLGFLSILIVVFAHAVLFLFVSGFLRDGKSVADVEVAASNVASVNTGSRPIGAAFHGNIDGKYKVVDVKPYKVRRNVSIENNATVWEVTETDFPTLIKSVWVDDDSPNIDANMVDSMGMPSNNGNDAASSVCVAAEQMGKTQQVNDDATPIKGTNHVAANRGVFLYNFASIKPDGADTNGGLNVDDVALHQARSDGKHAHGSPYNTGVKSFANLFNADCSKQKVNFRSLVNEEKVETFDTVLPMAAMDKVKHKFEKLMKTDDGVFLFKFATKTGMNQVLERGPWIICNMPLILNKWTPSLSLKKDECPKRVNLETPSKNKDPVIPSNASTHSDGFTKVKKKKNKGKKVYNASIANSFDALNNIEEGASSSRNIQEDDLETGNMSQWNEVQESDNEVDEFIFPESDKFGDKFDIRLKGRVPHGFSFQRLLSPVPKIPPLKATELLTPNLICPSTYQLLQNSSGDSGPDFSFDKSASLERLFSLARLSARESSRVSVKSATSDAVTKILTPSLEPPDAVTINCDAVSSHSTDPCGERSGLGSLVGYAQPEKELFGPAGLVRRDLLVDPLSCLLTAPSGLLPLRVASQPHLCFLQAQADWDASPMDDANVEANSRWPIGLGK
ncbi:retrovirus-related pol polyprotein from transposon TNT 1-94 [Tanacetum coccineum]